MEKEEIASKLIQNMMKFTKSAKKCHDKLMFKYNEMIVLIFISNTEGANPSEIGDKFGMPRPYIALMLNNLEKEEFIYRVIDAKDKRKFQLFTSEKGKQIISNNQIRLNKKIYQLVEGLGEKDALKLIELLEKSSKIMKEDTNVQNN